jgi:hypothetical protein
MLTCSKLQTEDPQILGTIVKNLVSRATSGPAFVHPWCQKKVSTEFTFKNVESRESWHKQQSFGRTLSGASFDSGS